MIKIINEKCKINIKIEQYGRIKNSFEMEGIWEIIEKALNIFLQTHKAFVETYEKVELEDIRNKYK